jgi:hypothetical protein
VVDREKEWHSGAMQDREMLSASIYIRNYINKREKGMSKFKVGDRVVCVDDTWSGGLSNGAVYTVTEVSETRVLVAGPPYWFSGSRFEPADSTQFKRDELQAALELVHSYKLGMNPSKGTVWAHYHASDMAHEEALDYLLPLETPAQKKLKELEQQQLAIVAQMEELRTSM